MIKLFDPTIGQEEGKVIKKILYSKFWASGSGSGYVSKFEKAFMCTNVQTIYRAILYKGWYEYLKPFY